MKEIEKISRIKDIFISDQESDDRSYQRQQIDFINFIKQYEDRRKLKCEDFYPELKDFIKKIKYENQL
jgi:hypothetical protein